MITSVKTFGTLAAEPKDAIMNYNIEIDGTDGDKVFNEVLYGEDVNDVLQRSMKFIINHFKADTHDH